MNREHPVRKPTRRRGFDYTTAGGYFITICAQHREPRFGTIETHQVILNPAGEMIARTWEENIARYPGTASDTYVIMPDHMHAIVLLGTEPNVDRHASLSRIVQSFKSMSTVEYTRDAKSGIYPPYDRTLWQRGFYERILRNDRELDFVRRYIEANPSRTQDRDDWLDMTFLSDVVKRGNG